MGVEGEPIVITIEADDCILRGRGFIYPVDGQPDSYNPEIKAIRERAKSVIVELVEPGEFISKDGGAAELLAGFYVLTGNGEFMRVSEDEAPV